MAPTAFDPDVSTAQLQRIRERLDAGEIVTFESRHRQKDGTVFPVEVRVRNFQQDGQRLSISLARDVTARKRAVDALREMQMELAHANRLATMGQLTASIAHEVNQPIAAAVISGHAALRWLAKETPDLTEVRRAIEQVIRDGNRAGHVIGRIRDLIHKAPPRKESLDINEAIREVLVLTGGEAVKHGVLVRSHLAEGLSLVQGDRVQLQQVILNLIINAIEAMSGAAEGARDLLISTGKAGPDAVLVAVQDSGPGLDPEQPERVFEAFYTTKRTGLGMGLSICRSIIDAHGGELTAAANRPHGAIFQFTVPVGGDTPMRRPPSA
jgi:C4-dicarboxylate-specific signal transduction histidine kinase